MSAGKKHTKLSIDLETEAIIKKAAETECRTVSGQVRFWAKEWQRQNKGRILIAPTLPQVTKNTP